MEFKVSLQAALITLGAALAYIVVAVVGQQIYAPYDHWGLLWPASGLCLALAYYGRTPAAIGVAIGTTIFLYQFQGWRWYDLAQASHTSLAFYPGGVQMIGYGILEGLQCAFSAVVLRTRMSELIEGSSRVRKWMWTLFLIGPFACLIKVAAPLLIYDWSTLWPDAQRFALLYITWENGALSILMMAPAIVLAELYRGAAQTSANRLRHQWLVLVLITLPMWAVVALARMQQDTEGQLRFHNASEALRSEVQARLDESLQKLKALRTFYHSAGDVPRTEFAQFADDLLDRDSPLRGLGWASRIRDNERAAVEERLSSELGRKVVFTERNASGDLIAAPHRYEYWPLFQVMPDKRNVFVGFDLMSEPALHNALERPMSDRLEVSARLQIAGANGGQEPAVLLYFATQKPKDGLVVASLSPSALMAGSDMVKALLDQGQILSLGDNSNQPLGTWGEQADVKPAGDPAYDRTLALNVGDVTWQLRVITPKSALPYLHSPLWWLGQLVPQILCIGVGLLLVLIAVNDRRLLRFERQYAGYLEHQRIQNRALIAPAQPFDALIDKAWQAGAFRPCYEPIVDIQSGQIVGAEALLRWPGAPAGLTTVDIIDWAQRTDTIAAVDQKILEIALRDLATWPLAPSKTFVLAVNVSATELQSPAWAQSVLNALELAGVAGRHLCIEITEGALVRADGAVIGQLARLRSAGVRIALDDFGTGYSAMAYLRQLPVDRIKLDDTFVSGLVSDIRARRIVAGIVSLSGSLGLDLVAEAVEDLATAEVLLQLGCSLGQGRLFSAGVDARSMGDLITRNTLLLGAKISSQLRLAPS